MSKAHFISARKMSKSTLLLGGKVSKMSFTLDEKVSITANHLSITIEIGGFIC